jgi:hypothetical protein
VQQRRDLLSSLVTAIVDDDVEEAREPHNGVEEIGVGLIPDENLDPFVRVVPSAGVHVDAEDAPARKVVTPHAQAGAAKHANLK